MRTCMCCPRSSPRGNMARWSFWCTAIALFVNFVLLRSVKAQAEATSSTGQVAQAVALPLEQLPGAQVAKRSTDLAEFSSLTIDQDVGLWKDKLMATGHLRRFIRRLAWGDKLFAKDTVLFIVSKGRIFKARLDYSMKADPGHRAEHLKAGLLRVQEELRLPLPDTMFLYNPHDVSACPQNLRCTVPIFSHFKYWNPLNTSESDEDFLIPLMNHKFDKAYNVPWEQKQPKALFRGALRCRNANETCTRREIYKLGEANPDVLDVGLTAVSAGTAHDGQLASAVPLEKQAAFKYLLELDGGAGSARTEKLLLTNSLVVRQKPQYIDAYDRALVNGTHLFEFDMGPGSAGVAHLVPAIRGLQASDAIAKQVAEAGQKFSARYMSSLTRGLIVWDALRKYNAMFNGDLELVARSLALNADRDVLEYCGVLRNADTADDWTMFDMVPDEAARRRMLRGAA